MSWAGLAGKEAQIRDPVETVRHYHAFGLRFRSDLALPELAPAMDEAAPDARIVLGPVGARLEGGVDLPPLMQAGPDAFQLDAEAGRYRVTGGTLITIDPAPGASDRDVRLYLLGSAIGALCHQRRRLALHAAALDIGGAAIAVAGPSGAGKSTLSALHARSGGGVLTDDLCAVTFDAAGRPVAHRGLQRVKLWPDSAELAGWTPGESSRIGDRIDKHSLPVFCPAPSLPLTRLYLLRPGESAEPTFRRLTGPEAAMAAVAQIYRWPLAVALERAAPAFEQCMDLARFCQIFELGYAHDPGRPANLHTALVEHGALALQP